MAQRVYFTLLLLNIFLSAQGFSEIAATSQPSQNSTVNCNEWETKYGKEGKCSVEISTTTWEIQYSREGKEETNWKKGVTTNLLVIFHPGGNDHRVHDYWDAWVGPHKAIDTTKWHVLSLGTLGDGKPSIG